MSYYQGDQSGWYATPDQSGGGGWENYGGGSGQPDYYAQQQPGSYGDWGGGGGSGYGFMPNATVGGGAAETRAADLSFQDEPPLLEELGINFDHIRQKTAAVLNPLGRTTQDVVKDQDLAGPLMFCLLFGAALLMQGKVQFGYIYGIGVLGCVGMYGLLNAMAPQPISVTCTVSVLGYCLLPMALLSLLASLASFQGALGLGVSGVAVVWCSASASKLFVTALAMEHQALLVAYPCGLLYAVFALLAVF